MTPTLMAERTRSALAFAMDVASPVLVLVEERVQDVVGSLDDRVRPIVARLVDAGGKRLRPLLVALSGLSFGASVDDLAELGAAVELVHAATLLHDDVIDEGVTRRGVPTANALYGDGPPVLSGDYLYARVFKRLLDLGHLDALARLATSVEEVVAGELLQLARRDDPTTSARDAVLIAERKTASLFSFATAAGARAGGAEGRALAHVSQFGRRLGLAFQVADDLIDALPGTGKDPGKDLREGTLTLPVIFARAMDPRMPRLLRRLVTTPRAERQALADEIWRRTRLAGGARRALAFERALAEAARTSLVAGFPAGAPRDALLALNAELVARGR